MDLNPSRAKLSKTLEGSDFTLIQERLMYEVEQRSYQTTKPLVGPPKKMTPQPPILVPLIGDECITKENQGGRFFSKNDYFALVDWTGRVVRENKVGEIPMEVIPILQKLQLPPHEWLNKAKQFKPAKQRRHYPLAA